MPLTEMNPSSTLNLTRPEGWRFPRLSWFHASATVVPIFLSDPSILPSVQKMEVSCTLDPTIIISNIVRGMKDTVGDRRISRVSFNRSGWNVDLIEEVARGGLKFETLIVHCIWFEHLAEDEMILNDVSIRIVSSATFSHTKLYQEKLMKVRNSLARLSAAGTLHSLFWSIETNGGNYPPPCLTTDEEVQWIIRFGEACPTLDTCQIPHGLHWCRYGDNIWVPEDEPSIKFVGTEWLIDQLHTRRYPALKELLETLDTKSEPLCQAFIQTVVKEYRDASAVVSDTEELARREQTEDLVIVATLTLFWSADWHGWIETPAYKRVIQRWKAMRDQRKKSVQGQVVQIQ
ncbi:hypothetical protein VNI00_000920 [Paramarasmius palmivorus]|uniref:Uncharacterized protein n=1 Tax=Paramarasmius palmivorus TaxID=297713 RepID=A0AAW0E9I9_9AGAR